MNASNVLEAIWNWRNDKLFRGFLILGDDLMHRTEARVQEFYAVQVSRPSSPVTQNGEDAMRWLRPKARTVKLNSYVVFKDDKAAVRILAKDGTGTVLWTWSTTINANTAIEAEVMGILLVIQLAAFRNYPQFINKGDNKALLDNLCLKKDCPR